MNSAETKNHAAVVAGRVSGIRSVKNDLIIVGGCEVETVHVGPAPGLTPPRRRRHP